MSSKESNDSVGRERAHADVRGGIGVFFSGGALSFVLVAAIALFGLLFMRGAQSFWPRPLHEWTMDNGHT